MADRTGSTRKHRAETLRYWASCVYLKIFGWKVEGELPDSPHAVVIAAPHTSNWDMPHMLAVAWHLRIHVSWLGKHTLFPAWVRPFFTWLGGIPVDRRASSGVVAQIVHRFEESEDLYLVVPPSGTRTRQEYWKSGFYHIACGAKVPILCSFLDYSRKVGGVGLCLLPSGNMTEDMDRIRAFYEPIKGKYPGKQSRARLKEEDAAGKKTTGEDDE